MKKTNAYFQLLMNESETYLKIFPSVDGGEDLTIDEVTSYLEKVNIHEYNIKDIGSLIHYEVELGYILLLYDKMYPVDEMMKITIAPNKLSVTVRFYAPSNTGKCLTRDEIIWQLNQEKVKFGIDEDVIDVHLVNPSYCTDIVIAKGLEPVHGKDAEIKYHFNTEPSIKPKLNEDGTVDFHQLDNIGHVKKGSVLATLIPEDRGTPGKDIYGTDIPPKKVVRKILRYSKDITLSEDGLSLISNIDGHAVLAAEKVYVYNTYDVRGDVDNSTGDIFYEGNVYIKGNVRAGFKVTASGNIEVEGVVEGAEVRAGGNIVLKRGIQGMEKGLLVCKGDLIAKFVESSTVIADGFIHTETILHSNVSAEGSILVQGSKGSLIGGNVRSGSLIEAKVIGSAMGTTTVVEVGSNPKLKDKINENNTSLRKKSEEIHKIKQLTELLVSKKKMGKLDDDKRELLVTVANNFKQLKEEIDNIKQENAKLTNSLKENASAKIKVIGDIHPGVKVVISGDFILVHNANTHCQYKKENGEIRVLPL